jgi:hypothetical protein
VRQCAAVRGPVRQGAARYGVAGHGVARLSKVWLGVVRYGLVRQGYSFTMEKLVVESHRFQVTLPRDLWDRLVALARSQRRSIAEETRIAIERHLSQAESEKATSGYDLREVH